MPPLSARSKIPTASAADVYKRQVVVLVSVLMGVLPFVLAYQVISPLVMGDSVETEFVLLDRLVFSNMQELPCLILL